MKTASLPSLRVAPELRDAAESVLQEGETLSSFLEKSLTENIARRKTQREFIARGLASRQKASETGQFIPAEKVLEKMDRMLSAAKAENHKCA